MTDVAAAKLRELSSKLEDLRRKLDTHLHESRQLLVVANEAHKANPSGSMEQVCNVTLMIGEDIDSAIKQVDVALEVVRTAR